MTSAIIIDDHPMLRKGISQLLELEDDIHLVAEVGKSKDALAVVLKYVPDLIIMDLNMAEQDGIQTLIKLRNAGISARIIIFTVSEDQDDIHRAFRNGADGYLLKDIDSDILLTSINRCIQGEQVVSPGLEFAGNNLPRRQSQTQQHNPALQDLTDRERDVLRLIASGLSNKCIGSELNIAEGTVKVHAKRVFSKLHLSSRVEAAIFAREHPN